MHRPHRPHRVRSRRSTPLLALLVAAFALTSCGGEDAPASDASASARPSASAAESGSASASPSPSPSARPEKPAGTTIDITITGDSVTPNGDRVKASMGEPITLEIDAEQAGELHVHSTPEREIAYPAGASTRKLKITQPGVVDIEDHGLGQVIVQLQVS